MNVTVLGTMGNSEWGGGQLKDRLDDEKQLQQVSPGKGITTVC